MQLIDIENDLLDYADFEEVGSVARAKSFVTAAKRWLILQAESSSNQSSSLSLGKAHVEKMLQRAQEYVAANASHGTGGVRFLGVGSNFR